MKGTKDKSNAWFYMPYALIIVISIFLCSVITVLTYRLVINEQTMQIYTKLQTAAANVGNSMEEIDMVYKRIINDSRIRMIAASTNSQNRTKELWNLSQNYNGFSVTSALLSDYGIYLNNNETALYSERIILKPERVYETMLKNANLSWNEFENNILMNYGNSGRYYEECSVLRISKGTGIAAQEQCVIYTKPFINTSTGNILGTCVFYISADRLSRYFDMLPTDAGSFVQLTSNDVYLTGI